MAKKNIRKAIVVCDWFYSSTAKKKFKHKQVLTDEMISDFDEEIQRGVIKEVFPDKGTQVSAEEAQKAEEKVTKEKPNKSLEKTKEIPTGK